jgi:Bacteriophage HK97-gp10, putative tail-component
MTRASISVEGLEQTQRMLKDAPKTLVARGFVKALSAAANVLADAVERETPVKVRDTGGLLDRGVLRESLMIAVELDGALHGGAAYVGFGKNGIVALWIEYGHVLTTHRPVKHPIKFVPANPFMRTALGSSWEQAVDAFARALGETVRQEFPVTALAA